MLIVTIAICRWCNSPRPTKVTVQGIDRVIPPGKYQAEIDIKDDVCIPCGTRFSDGISKGGVTHSDTSKDDTATGKEEGGI